MMVCLCHPFSDKKVKAYLEDGGCDKMSSVYSACSGGEKPNCCSCLETLKDIVKTHSKTAAA